MKNVTYKDDRKHVFTFLLYPDDIVPDWRDYFSSLLIPICVSPLHDKDVSADGKPKKPHYHVVVDFGQNKKSLAQLHTLFDGLGPGVCIAPIRSNGLCDSWVSCKRTMIRYLVHADNPDKAQYSTNDISVFGGFDFWSIFNSSSNKYDTIRNIIKFCRDQGIDSFDELFDYCMEYNEMWFMTLCDSGVYLVKEYLKSKSYRYNRSRNMFPKDPEEDKS